MARKSRIHIPNGFYYVTLSGNGDKSIFLSIDDSGYFEDLTAENIVKYGCEVHAYCWMNNQAHLIIKVGNTPLTKFIHNISFRYTLYFNRLHKKNGHLFNGRYRAFLIDPRNYLLQIVQYIHLMPLRAGIVSKPQEYKWSSHRAYLGRTECSWLTTGYLMSLFSHDNHEAIHFYNQYIQNEIVKGYAERPGSKSRKDTRIIGDDEFVQEILSYQNEEPIKVGLNKIILEVCKRFDTDTNEISSQSRSRRLSRIRTLIGYFVLEYSDTTLSDYGRIVNRDVSTLSGAIAKYRSILKKDVNNQQLISELKQEIGIR